MESTSKCSFCSAGEGEDEESTQSPNDAMRNTTAAIDSLWQCLCPWWSQRALTPAAQFLRRPERPIFQCPTAPRASPQGGRRYNSPPNLARLDAASRQFDADIQPMRRTKPLDYKQIVKPLPRSDALPNLENESARFLYGRLRSFAVDGKTEECREIAEYLVKERRERPSTQIYNSLILSNTSHDHGSAWRVSMLLDEMHNGGLQPDSGTCHAVLKVLAVHLDHLLRADILDYMQKRWYSLSEEGQHDVVAGLLREGLFEQALQRLDDMRSKVRVDAWLWDMTVYVLCDAGEVEEAYRIMRIRHDSSEMNLSKSLWSYLLDKGSEARHHDATALAWNSQVNQGYIIASSGVCLNVLATAAQAGDAVMATEVFAHLSERGTAFRPVHYELLISTYLSASPPDLSRAISILTIMPLEKMEPTIAETRPLFLYLRDKPALVKEAFFILRELHAQDRKIPIAALNLLIECYVEQNNLSEAMKIYKLIHTFVPISQGVQKSFANIETFNLLLKGCRTVDPPDEQQASFLVSELLALRIIPTSLTYDRLILVFVTAGKASLQKAARLQDAAAAQTERRKGMELLDWALRHFADMRPLGWMPRFGTLEQLAMSLAEAGDERCWDVLQTSEDQGKDIGGFALKGKHMRRNVEEGWNAAMDARQGAQTGVGGFAAVEAAA